MFVRQKFQIQNLTFLKSLIETRQIIVAICRRNGKFKKWAIKKILVELFEEINLFAFPPVRQ